MTETERDTLLKRIVEKTDADEEILDIIQQIREGFSVDETQDAGGWKERYTELKKKYVERFFNPKKSDEDDITREDEVVEEKKDKTYTDIFEKEGNNGN